MARSKYKRGKHHLWVECAYEYLLSQDDEIPATELPKRVPQKNGLPFRNAPLQKGVASILNRDKRFQLNFDKARKAFVIVKRRDD